MIRASFLRIISAIPVALLVICGVFALIHLAPGDAASQLAPDQASDFEVAQLRSLWGLDKPLYVQLWAFIKNASLLELGQSLRYQQPNAVLIASRLPATLELAFSAMVLATLVGVWAGMIAALKKGKWQDVIVSSASVAGVSAPSFWLGLLFVLVFSSWLNLLPSGGRLPFGMQVGQGSGFYVLDTIIHGQFDYLAMVLRHLILPALTLAAGIVGIVARITRSACVDILQEDFILTAMAKGLSRSEILRRHLLPNVAVPVGTILGLEFGTLISGTIVVEVIFSWPGLGNLLYEAVTVRDTPLATSIVLVYAAMFIGLNIIIDLGYALIDPRVRSSVTSPA